MGFMGVSRWRRSVRSRMPSTLITSAWLFAETLAKAIEAFGSQGKAEEWLGKPAMGLDGQRPIEPLQTVQGAELGFRRLA